MEQDKKDGIKENIRRLKDRVSDLEIRSGKSAGYVTIIGVSKRFPAEYAKTAFENGLCDLGENRIEELLEKKEILSKGGINPNWHMIGTLQRKKVKKAVGNACLIHSVDSLKLANEISDCSINCDLQSPVLLQVNVSGEESKQGFSKSEIIEMLDEIYINKGIIIRGLMTMAPFTDDKYILEKVFSDTFDLFNKIRELKNGSGFNILSMGMSNDYPLAIKHGATHIRVGTAIFGERT